MNEKGVEVFGVDAIINEFRNEFICRLTPLKINEELKRFEEMTLEMSKMCVELLSAKIITPDYTIDELDKAINELKKGKSWPDNFPPEIFIQYMGERS